MKTFNLYINESNLYNKYYNNITKEFTKWPYRFKTSEELDKDYNYDEIDNCWITSDYLFIESMKYLLGTTLEYDFPEYSSEILISARNGGHWYITKDMLVKNGDGRPNYKPKKFNKTLENFNSFNDAYEITIIINNLDELNLLYDNIKPLGYVIDETYFNYIKNSHEPINIFINLKNGDISQSIMTNDHRRKFKILNWLDGVYEKEFTIKDLKYIVRILEAGKIIEERPNYKPKKFNKLTESNTYQYPYRFKTEEEMIKEYGEDWRDADNTSLDPNWTDTSMSDDGMDNLLGTEYPYNENELDKGSYRPRRERFIDKNGNDWAIGWWMLTKNKLLKPNYKPKKFKREL
jgi:hypothetical protein